MRQATLSGATEEALALLGASVKVARLRRNWTVAELAQRVGVSRPTITKIEQGDAGVAIGTALEAAHLVGVPLFDVSAEVRERYGLQKGAELALLPEAARARRSQVDDDF